MHKHVRRTHAARFVVLALVAVLTFAWVQLTGSSGDRSARPVGPDRPVLAEGPVAQAALPGSTLTPGVAVPAPAQPKAAPKHRRTSHHRHHRARHGHRHRHHAAAARRARLAQERRRANRWLHTGGRDIGWPQCPRDVGFRGHNGLGQPMPDEGVQFVVVGLTNGRAFTPNPCLDRHLDWVRSHHVQASAYAFAAYPSRGQLHRYRNSGPWNGRQFVGALANAGHATAAYNVRLMQAHGFVTPHVWLDVEPSSTNPWSHRRSWNRAVVRGWIRGYRDAGYTVGIYSTTNLWRGILGRMRLGLPEWRTAGPVSARTALGKCGRDPIQGGRAVIAQWWTDHRDFDRLCPGTSTVMEQYFHQW